MPEAVRRSSSSIGEVTRGGRDMVLDEKNWENRMIFRNGARGCGLEVKALGEGDGEKRLGGGEKGGAQALVRVMERGRPLIWMGGDGGRSEVRSRERARVSAAI